MADDLLVGRKQEQRRKLLRALYGLSNGKEGFTISPMNYVAVGSQVGVRKEEVLEAVQFFVAEGLLSYKPASEAVALTHKGVVTVEQNSATIAAERSKRLEGLPDKITAVLESAPDTLNLIQVRASLPEYRDFDDVDFFEALKVLEARGIVSTEIAAGSVGQAVNTAHHFGIASRSRVNLSDATKLNVITLGGEVFEAAYQRKENADNRAGVLYLFTATDRKKGRGLRHLMLLRGGAKDYYARDYDERIETARLNAIRRAFDSGALTFDREYEEDKYIELKLQQADFRPRSPAVSDEQLRLFIKRMAYWLGYKLNSNTGKYSVHFDNEQDLDYLGATRDDVKRNVWRLQREGFLDASEMPGIGFPLPPLLDEIEALDLEPAKTKERITVTEDSRKVFLVHGHNDAMESQVARFLERLDLIPIILHEQANQGRTIIEKFERHSSDVGFAVVLLSPDDVGSVQGGNLSPRARQNVILELGYFIGKLGRERVCALHAGEVELPSDLHGVVWVPYSGDWKLKLIQELKAAGIRVDMNRL